VRRLAALRILALLCALLAAVGLSLPLPSSSRSVIILIDVSDSMGQAKIEEERSAAARLVAGLGRGDRVRALAFAGRTRSLGGPWKPESAIAALASARLEAPEPGSTDLDSALGAALALAREDGLATASVVLLGDGRANRGGLSAVSGLAAAGVPVFALPLGREAAGIRSLGMKAPASARPGQALSLAWSLSSDRAREVDWELLVDGEATRRGRSALAAGTNVLRFELGAGEAGARRVEARVLGEDGEALPWAEAGVAIAVDGSPSVLVLSGGDHPSPIAAALLAQGLAARTGQVADLPEGAAGYTGISAVVLDDIPALSLSEAQQDGLVAFAVSGGGLLFVGGPSSFGRGEYYATALEDLLPVETDTRQRLFFTRARLLFVIDHSASMAQVVGGESKQLAAMRGVEAAVRELNPGDEVGIIGFDSAPTWVLPFTKASETASVDRALSSLDEGGGTDLGAAIEAGIRGFGPPGPAKRHMIVLTDGLSSSTDGAELSAKLKEAAISLSAVAIGTEINEGLLKGLAESNGGAYYRVESDKVPRILDEETVRLTRDLIQEGQRKLVFPKADPLVEGLGGGPPIRGYIMTRLKSLATAWALAPVPGSEGRMDPVLATWRYGAGRVAAFTSDSGARWLAAWRGLPEYNRLWAQVIRSVEGPAPTKGLRLSLGLRASTALVSAEARRPDGRAYSGLRLVARDREGKAGAVALKETAPGRYEAHLPLTSTGLHRIDVEEGMATGEGLGASAWLWYQPSAELAALGPDAATLAYISGSGKGAFLDPASPHLPRAEAGFRAFPARGLFSVLALAFLLLELYLRSALAGQVAAALAALASWRARLLGEADDLRRRPYRGIPRDLPDKEEDDD
jgi:Mg-chelatase subunit ChlD